MWFYIKNNEYEISILIVNNMNSIYLGKPSQKGGVVPPPTQFF